MSFNEKVFNFMRRANRHTNTHATDARAAMAQAGCAAITAGPELSITAAHGPRGWTLVQGPS
jgi:hypothetical protein